MRLGLISGLLLAVYVIGMGVWILAFRPDPPAAARTATRKSRRIIAIGAIILGIANIVIQLYPFSPE